MLSRIVMTVPAIFVLGCSALVSDNSKTKFSSGEHEVLGDAGFRKACTNYAVCSNRIFRLDGTKSFSYGELVAFSGDFYGTPDEIYRETEKPFLTWKRNDVDDVKENFKKEITTIENFLHGHSDEQYPDFNLSSAWNYPDYLNLALANSPHFGFYNMKTYIKYHSLAMVQAKQAHDLLSINANQAAVKLNEAIFTNAFADHFLTDGFASGHIRNPRVQILDWAKSQNLSDRAAGTLAKILHDRDGEVRESGEHGLNVTNARGDDWLTRCDSQLFWKNTMEDKSIQLPIQAVEASVRELLDVYETGEIAQGLYAAASFVPYPAVGERNLINVFPANMADAEYDQLNARMAFYTKIKAFSGVDKGVLKRFAAELPQIMQRFRNDIHGAIVQDQELSRHLPAAYLSAYSNIR